MFVCMWIRATYPRYRYDQLMKLGWKVFLPLTLFLIVGNAIWITLFQVNSNINFPTESLERIRK